LRATVDDELARAPRVDLAYKAVPGNTADFYALQVLGAVLQGGQSSRLYQKLVKDKQVAVQVGVPALLHVQTPGNVPLALGSALAARLSVSDAVAVVFFGDGAVQGGIFVESVNIAALWRLPAILVCENNGFAEFTPRSAHTVVERVSDVVAPYGFPRETVDGNDLHAVHEAFGRFLARARGGEGPFLLECLTHRLGGHYEGDPQHYREQIGDDDWRAIDPILRLGGGEGLEEEARAEVEDAVEFARASPYPSADLTERLVYA